MAYNIIGGGEEGDKTTVSTKEQADHSLPYMLAVAILDGQVMPEQYEQERIRRADVQALLGKVSVQPGELLLGTVSKRDALSREDHSEGRARARTGNQGL